MAPSDECRISVCTDRVANCVPSCAAKRAASAALLDTPEADARTLSPRVAGMRRGPAVPPEHRGGGDIGMEGPEMEEAKRALAKLRDVGRNLGEQIDAQVHERPYVVVGA